MKLNEIKTAIDLEYGEQLIEEGFFSRALEVIEDSAIGSLLGGGGMLVGLAGNFMASGVPAWTAIKMVLLTNQLPMWVGIGAGAITGGTAIGIAALSGALFWTITSQIDSGQVKRDLKTLQKNIKVRDEMIQKFNRTKDGELLLEIIELTEELDELAQDTFRQLSRDEGMPKLLSPTGPLTDEQREQVKAFMSAASKRNGKGRTIIISNLDKNELRRFNDAVEKQLEETEVPDEAEDSSRS